MKAAIYRRYGAPHVVKIEEVPTPQPQEHELLIQIHASTVSTGDMRARSLKMPRGFELFARPVFGFFAPRKKILGTEFSGRVAQVGPGVTQFKVGDAVFGFTGFDMGCHAQFRLMRESDCVLPMPQNLDFAHAAALCFGGTTALHFLNKLPKAQAHARMLVVGAAGAVGSAAVQLAKNLGYHVVGVSSGANLKLIQGLGCDEQIDYTQPNAFQNVQPFDVIYDAVGAGGYLKYRALLKNSGTLIMSGGDLFQLFENGKAKKNGHRVLAGPVPKNMADIRTLKALAESGRYQPLIHHVFPFSEIAQAHAQVDTGHKKGSVVVTWVA